MSDSDTFLLISVALPAIIFKNGNKILRNKHAYFKKKNQKYQSGQVLQLVQ
jgi:hypothetical protein